MELNAANLATLNNAVVTAFNQSILGHDDTWKTIAMEVNSTSSGNFYPKLDDIPGMREWFGDRVVHDLDMDGFTLLNRKFENTLGIPVDLD